MNFESSEGRVSCIFYHGGIYTVVEHQNAKHYIDALG